LKIPCEIIVWYILPGIRKELAMSLIEDHKMTQTKVASLLGVTEAAISQYRSSKRGNLEFTDEVIRNEIKKSAQAMIDGNEGTMINEMCRICGLIKSSNILSELYTKHTGSPMPDCAFN
jgi:predicted transcriptional regulator